MRVEESHPSEPSPQPVDLAAKRRMIWVEIKPPPVADLIRSGRLSRPVKRLAVECRRRTEFCRLKARIEGGAARVAIDVDDRTRKQRPHDSCAERSDKIVKLLEQPIRVLPREPRIDEIRLERGEVRAGMRNADDQRRRAALDDQPVGALGGHRTALSRPGK